MFIPVQNLLDEKEPKMSAKDMLSERELDLWLSAPKPRVLTATKMAQLSARMDLKIPEEECTNPRDRVETL